jgi:uncharacterized protein DUF861
MDLQLINFDQPAETRHFEKGRFDVYRVGPATLGRATYQPGWSWSEHVGPLTGQASCQVEHVSLVLSGRAVAVMDDGTEVILSPGDFFYVPPDTTAGSSARSPTSRFTSWAEKITWHLPVSR